MRVTKEEVFDAAKNGDVVFVLNNIGKSSPWYGNGYTVLENGLREKESEDASPLWEVLLRSISASDIDKGDNLIDKGDNFKKTFLMHAAESCPEAIVSLVGAGADVNAKSVNNETPLMYAARCQPLGIVKFLITSGAKVKEKNEDGETALMLAAKSSHPEIVPLLINEGEDVNAKERSYGNTPLMFAADNCCPDAVGYLVAARADVNAKNKTGETPLMYAVRSRTIQEHWEEDKKRRLEERNNRMKDVVEALVAAGADVNAKNERGATALHRVTRPDVLRILLSHGADVNARDDEGCTPFMRAALAWEPENLVELVAAGADANAEAGWGRNAWEPEDLVELVAARANANAEAGRGKNTLDKIVKCYGKDSEEVVETEFYSSYRDLVLTLVAVGSDYSSDIAKNDKAVLAAVTKMEDEMMRITASLPEDSGMRDLAKAIDETPIADGRLFFARGFLSMAGMPSDMKDFTEKDVVECMSYAVGENKEINDKSVFYRFAAKALRNVCAKKERVLCDGGLEEEDIQSFILRFRENIKEMAVVAAGQREKEERGHVVENVVVI